MRTKKKGCSVAMRSRIERICRERGTTRYRLSKDSGVSEAVLWKWERAGLDRAQFGLVLRVARALEVPVEDLYEEEREGVI